MANKMTQRDYFNEIIALARENGRDDLVEFAQGRIDALSKKKAGAKPTAKQAENEVLKTEIAKVLGEVGGLTATEITKHSDALAGLTPQKVSALLKQMIDAGVVRKDMDKKSAKFSLVPADDEVVSE